MHLRSFLGAAASFAAVAALLAGCGATPGAAGGARRAGESALGTGRGAVHKTGSNVRRATRTMGRAPVTHKATASLGGLAKGVGTRRQGRRAAGATATPNASRSHGGGPAGAGGAGMGRGDRNGMPAHGASGAVGRRGAPASSVPTSVTAAMAGQGATLYTALRCASCHGPQGAGTSAAPALNGTGPVPVLTTYPSPEALATFIHQNMPLTNPGSLTASQADELAAYVYYTLNHHAPAAAARPGSTPGAGASGRPHRRPLPTPRAHRPQARRSAGR